MRIIENARAFGAHGMTCPPDRRGLPNVDFGRRADAVLPGEVPGQRASSCAHFPARALAMPCT